MQQAASLRIGDVARRVGIHPSTIRKFEQRGLLTPARDWAGQRRFTDKDVAALCALVAQPPAGRRKARRA